MKDSMPALPLVLAAAALATSAAYAQAPVKPGGYPARPVRVIVTFAAGGAADFVTRIVAQKLSERIGQQFVVENRAGAAGNIGAEAVAKSPNDGYTLLMVEAGLPGFESVGSYALLAPAGTSKDIVAYLNRETNAVLQLADLKEKLVVAGIDPAGSTPEALDAFTKAEVVKWAQVIKAAGITPE